MHAEWRVWSVSARNYQCSLEGVLNSPSANVNIELTRCVVVMDRNFELCGVCRVENSSAVSRTRLSVSENALSSPKETELTRTNPNSNSNPSSNSNSELKLEATSRARWRNDRRPAPLRGQQPRRESVVRGAWRTQGTAHSGDHDGGGDPGQRQAHASNRCLDRPK